MNKTLLMMGLARRAGKLLIGHDAVMEAVKKQNVKLILLTSDASARHKRELQAVGYAGKTVALDCDMQSAGLATGRQSCIFALEDAGFADAVLKTTDEEETQYGCKI